MYENKISEILSILDEDSRESKKWQGKIASGIVEKEHNKVCESLLYFVIPHAEYEIKEESLLEIVDEIE